MPLPSFCAAPRLATVLLAAAILLSISPARALSRAGAVDVRWVEGAACFGLPAGELRRLKRVLNLQTIWVYDLERSATVPLWLDDYPWHEPRSLDPDGCVRYGDAQGSAAHKPLPPLRVGVAYMVVMRFERTRGSDPTMFHWARFCLRRQLDGAVGLITLKQVEDKGWNTWACESP